MNTVVYSTYDLQPITVLQLPQRVLDYIERYGSAKIGIKPLPDEPDTVKGREHITLYSYKLKDHRNQVYPIIVTPDEVDTLSLLPEWLPGQLQVVQHLMDVIEKQSATIKKLQ